MGSHGEKVSLQEIEAGLERLMPRGLSEETRLNLESVVDGLASEACPVARASSWVRPVFWAAAAAFLVAAGTLLILENSEQTSFELAFAEAAASPRVELLNHRTWIESGSELGARTFDEVEEVSQGWSYSGVEEERVLHQSSGYEVILQREFTADYFSTSSL